MEEVYVVFVFFFRVGFFGELFLVVISGDGFICGCLDLFVFYKGVCFVDLIVIW